MNSFTLRRNILSCAISLAMLPHIGLAQSAATANDSATTTETTGVLKTVKVSASSLEGATEGTGSYTTGATTTATGLNLSIRDTPQSVSVITAERMADEGMNSVADALRSTTGISVKAVDRGRNSVSARGFDVNNFQFDGVPTVTGNIGIETASTAIYDRVEVVRGATGLLSGAGDPSAAVNLVRKRAESRTFTGRAELTGGSWDHRGGTVDLTTPLQVDGDVRLRLVAGKDTQDAFIDLEKTENRVFYSVLNADLGAHTDLSIGASYEQTDRDGVYWGGLPLWFSDGTRTDWARSKTTAATWNQWDTREHTLFATVDHRFASDWRVRANATYYKQKEYSDLLWVYGNPDRTTGEGMEAYPYLYGTEPEQKQADLLATGPFQLFGRAHELTVGIMYSRHEGGWDNGGVPISEIPPVGNIYEWDGSYPAPVWGAPEIGSREITTQNAAYTAARLQFTERFKTIAGVRVSNWEVAAEAAAWTAEAYTIEHQGVVTPYLGLIYDLSTHVSTYASYSDIFKAQTRRDRNGDYLNPLSGATYELGVKSELLDSRLNLTAAVFQTQQDNFAVADGGQTVPGTNIQAYYGADGTESKGYELEMTGELTPDWNISLGWTQFSAKDANDQDVAVEHPRKTLKLFSKYSLRGAWNGLSIGSGINWQSEEPRTGENPVTGLEEAIGQPSYTLVDLMMRYEFNDHIAAQFNLNNALDETYYESSWGTFTYGDPRNMRLALDYRF